MNDMPEESSASDASHDLIPAPVEAGGSNLALRWVLIAQSVGLIVGWALFYLGIIRLPGWLSTEAKAVLMATSAVDAIIVLTGCLALVLWYRHKKRWRILALICMSIVLTGSVQTLAFAVFSGRADILSWILGLLFILYPLYFIRNLSRRRRHRVMQGV